jgi:hypothetical protein
MNHYEKKESHPSAGRVWAIGFALLFLALALLLLPVAMHAQQGVTNTFNVAQFPGADVGAKITAAQSACLPNTAIPCTIVIDSILAAWPQGVTPARCSNCLWMDYRTSGSLGLNGTGGSLGLSGSNIFFSIANVLRDPRTDGTLDLTGVSDDAGLINTAIANAIANNQGQVRLPCGKLLINSCINLTNITGGMDFAGCGGTGSVDTGNTNMPLDTSHATTLIGNTGAGGCVIDRTGSSGTTLHDFNIAVPSGASNPSSIGIIDARDDRLGTGALDPFCFNQFNKIRNVYIAMPHNQALNSANGTVAVYNVNGEHYYIEPETRFIADRTMMFLTFNALGVVSPYQTINTGCPGSMTDVYVMQNSSLSGGTTGLAMIASQASEIHFTMQHTQAGTSSNAPAFEIGGPAQTTGVYIDGRCESAVAGATGACVYFAGNANNVNIDLGTSALSGTTGGWIGANNTGYTITNSRFRVETTDAGLTLPLFSNIGITIKNSRFDLSNSTAPLTAGATCLGCIIDAPNHFPSQITFAAGSKYTTRTSTGVSSSAMTFTFACSGTATSSATLGINNTGVTTCTTALTAPTTITAASGTLSDLEVKCGTGGINSSSGVFTVIAAGSGTSLTCTTGAGTTCADLTHSASITAGGALQIRFTTQAAETLANCSASVLQN